MRYDAIIVGGGPAGLQAALVLGRMRRRVLVCDSGQPANAVSHGVGGMLTRDGTPPAELRALAREQIAAYPSVTFRDEEVGAVAKAGEGFEVRVGDETLPARKLLLAHGLDYGLPELEGVAELWGERLFHCPYCHGWEVRDKAIAVVACGPRVAHQALLLRSICDDLVVLAGGRSDIKERERGALERAGIEIVDEEIERLERDGEEVRVVLAGHEPLARHAIFIQPDLRLACEFAAELGAELDNKGSVAVDPSGGTGVHGLRVIGDAGSPPQSVAVAIGTGATAAYATNAELALEAYEPPLAD